MTWWCRAFIGERIRAEEEAAAKKDEKKRLLQGEKGISNTKRHFAKTRKPSRSSETKNVQRQA
jgi:hypothetical protein